MKILSRHSYKNKKETLTLKPQEKMIPVNLRKYTSDKSLLSKQISPQQIFNTNTKKCATWKNLANEELKLTQSEISRAVFALCAWNSLGGNLL